MAWCSRRGRAAVCSLVALLVISASAFFASIQPSRAASVVPRVMPRRGAQPLMPNPKSKGYHLLPVGLVDPTTILQVGDPNAAPDVVVYGPRVSLTTGSPFLK